MSVGSDVSSPVMAIIDSEQERRRLAEFYAGQLDGELEKVAREGYELSEPAREALRAELAKRGLDIELVEAIPPVRSRRLPVHGPMPGDPPPRKPMEELPAGELELREMVTVRRFRDLPEALIAKGSLDSAGIECALVNENLVRLDWFWSNLMGGVKLDVDPDDVEAANEILSQPIPEHLEVSGVGDYEQPSCPKCGSRDVNFREIAPVAYVTMMLGNFPIPVHRRAWRCHTCDVEWEDDGLPDSPESGQ
jgi:hypothetical protein